MKVLLGYLYLCAAWGTSWMVIKFSNAAFPPLMGASFRFWLAGLILLGVATLSGSLQRLERNDLKLLLWTGLLTFNIGYGIVYLAEMHIDSGIVATLFATFPIFCAFLGHWLIPEEKLGIQGFLGVFLGFIGVAVLSFPGLGGPSVEDVLWMLLVILSPFACALNVVMIKRRGDALNPYTLNIIPMIMGGAGLMVLSFLSEDLSTLKITVPGLMALGHLTIVVTVIAFSLYYWLLKRMPLVLLSSTAYLSLILAVIAGYAILGEPVTLRRIMGIAFILVGVSLVQRDQRDVAVLEPVPGP